MKKTTKKERQISISIKFPYDLYLQLRKEARKQERSMGAMVRVLVKERVDKSNS